VRQGYHPKQAQQKGSVEVVSEDQADRAGEGRAQAPSGLYSRREKKANDAQRNNTGAHAGAAEDWESTKIHLKSSEFCGSEIREVSEGHVIKLIDKWLPVFKSAAKTTADDKRLAFALEQWQARKANEPDDTGESVEESDLDEVPL
jgi:hypothetical protein